MSMRISTNIVCVSHVLCFCLFLKRAEYHWQLLLSETCASPSRQPSPWYNHTGWLSVKHQVTKVTYLFTPWSLPMFGSFASLLHIPWAQLRKGAPTVLRAYYYHSVNVLLELEYISKLYYLTHRTINDQFNHTVIIWYSRSPAYQPCWHATTPFLYPLFWQTIVLIDQTFHWQDPCSNRGSKLAKCYLFFKGQHPSSSVPIISRKHFSSVHTSLLVYCKYAPTYPLLFFFFLKTSKRHG